MLAPAVRQRLVLAMLADVLGALRMATSIERMLVVTPDQTVACRARDFGAIVVPEPTQDDLNGAIRAGIGQAMAVGSRAVMVLPGDVPLLTSLEIERVVGSARIHPPLARHMVIVPSITNSASATVGSRPDATPKAAGAPDPAGTNALALWPPDVIAPCFGPSSFELHLAQARAKGVACEVARPPGLGFDIDGPADLERLCRVPRYAWLVSCIRNAALECRSL